MTRGKVADPAGRYPTVMQFFRGGITGAVHFAQTDVGDDGSYKYRFTPPEAASYCEAVLPEGDYAVAIFKAVSTHTGRTRPKTRAAPGDARSRGAPSSILSLPASPACPAEACP